ncbi:Ribokinase-like protein [Pestalotiopsis sp. NC0098]|nr:Ribokinase-like protein [Pestalotiopsis sp. NC0098]
MHDRSLLFCTWGSDGASCLSLPSGRCLSCAASPEGQEIQVVDTVGAGDTFIAGILFGLLIYDSDWALQRKLQFAVQLATCKVQREGFQGLGQYVTI